VSLERERERERRANAPTVIYLTFGLCMSIEEVERWGRGSRGGDGGNVKSKLLTRWVFYDWLLSFFCCCCW